MSNDNKPRNRKAGTYRVTLPALTYSGAGMKRCMTYIRGDDLLRLTAIDFLDASRPLSGLELSGYQRPLSEARIPKIGRYILEGGEIPPIILSAREGFPVQSEAGDGVSYDTATVGASPLYVVDGQHRLEGVRWATLKDETVGQRYFAVEIYETLGQRAEMELFSIINRTSVKARTDLVNEIAAHLAFGTPQGELTRTQQKRVVMSTVVKWLQFDPHSFWCGQITMPDQSSGYAHVVGSGDEATRIVKAVVFDELWSSYIVLDSMGYLTDEGITERATKLAMLVSDYWFAVRAVSPGGFTSGMSMSRTTSAVAGLHGLMGALVSHHNRLGKEGLPSVQDFTEYLAMIPLLAEGEIWETELMLQGGRGVQGVVTRRMIAEFQRSVQNAASPQ